MDKETLMAIINGTPGVILQIAAADLRTIVEEVVQNERERIAQTIEQHREKPTMTRAEVAKALNVDASTLWRWAKCGYLTPVKIGSKVLYRASDIERMITRKQDFEMRTQDAAEIEAAYTHAVTTGRQTTRELLTIALRTYLNHLPLPLMSRKVATKFNKYVKPYGDLLKAQNP